MGLILPEPLFGLFSISYYSRDLGQNVRNLFLFKFTRSHQTLPKERSRAQWGQSGNVKKVVDCHIWKHVFHPSFAFRPGLMSTILGRHCPHPYPPPVTRLHKKHKLQRNPFSYSPKNKPSFHPWFLLRLVIMATDWRRIIYWQICTKLYCSFCSPCSESINFTKVMIKMLKYNLCS